MADSVQPQDAGYFGTDITITNWMDKNLAGYLEANPGAIQWKNLLGTTNFQIPTGTVLEYGGATCPDGYVWCDGATYDGTKPMYLDLWAKIGILHGGTAQNSFKVPDKQGRVAVGFAVTGGHVDVSTIGLTDAIALANRRSTHNHTAAAMTTSAVSAGTPAGTISSVTYVQDGGAGFAITHSGPNSLTSVTTTPAFTGSALGTHSHSVSGTVGPAGTNPIDTPAYIVLPSIIKL